MRVLLVGGTPNTGKSTVARLLADRPRRVAELTASHTGSVWLTADETTPAARMHAASDYDGLGPDECLLVDVFLARAVTRPERGVPRGSTPSHGLDRRSGTLGPFMARRGAGRPASK